MAKDLRSKKISQMMYISIGCAIAAVILFTTLFIAFNNRKNTEKFDLQIGESNSSEETKVQDASSSIGQKVDEMDEYKEIGDDEELQVQLGNEENTNNELQDTNANIEENTEKQENNLSNVGVNIEEKNNQTEDTQQDPVFIIPVEGEIIKQYGKEKLIYSDTLKEWTTHLGIDIKAEKTTVVKSSTDGCIKSIKNDPRYGLTVVIEHNNGFTSVYSNLLTAEFVVVGEKVKSGQTIGTVGNSATFEILDDPHLHFEILKDGNSVDPEMYIK